MSVIDPSGGARNSQRSIFSKSSISYENPDNAINNLNINMATNINKNQSRNIIISATNSMTGRSRQSARESGITKNSKIYLR